MCMHVGMYACMHAGMYVYYYAFKKWSVALMFADCGIFLALEIK